MKNNILKNFVYFLIAALGFFTLTFFSFRYTNADNGYGMMSMWDFGFAGVMVSLIQIFILLFALGLIAFGAFGILKVFKVYNKMPDNLGKMSTNSLAEIALFTYLGLNVLMLVFMIILVSSRSYLSFNAGIFVTLFNATAAIVAHFIIKNMSNETKAPEKEAKSEEEKTEEPKEEKVEETKTEEKEEPKEE